MSVHGSWFAMLGLQSRFDVVHDRSCCRDFSSHQLTSLQSQFYKTFSRPIAKVLILAVFTYQVTYWTWTKLEADEVRAKMDG